MPKRVDLGEHPNQVPTLDPPLNHASPNAERKELRIAHPPGLPISHSPRSFYGALYTHYVYGAP
ncbi:MAG TPA: hypothetical protein VGH24_02350 [Solirubrobacteraceae bacterium]